MTDEEPDIRAPLYPPRWRASFEDLNSNDENRVDVRGRKRPVVKVVSIAKRPRGRPWKQKFRGQTIETPRSNHSKAETKIKSAEPVSPPDGGGIVIPDQATICRKNIEYNYFWTKEKEVELRRAWSKDDQFLVETSNPSEVALCSSAPEVILQNSSRPHIPRSWCIKQFQQSSPKPCFFIQVES